MTRLEENGKFIDEIVGEAMEKPTGTYEEMVVFHLGAIVTTLIDISRSLAVLADKAERSECKE